MTKRKRLADIAIAILIFAVAFFYRFPAFHAAHPFWVDEFSTAVQASRLATIPWNYLLEHSWLIEHENWLPYALSAISMSAFGMSVESVRLPFLIIGSLLPVAAYFWSRKLFGTRASFIVVVLLIFSYLQIAWSLQARGYQLQQLLLVALLMSYQRLKSKKNSLLYVCIFISLSIAGLLTHKLFVFVLAALLFAHAVNKYLFLRKVGVVTTQTLFWLGCVFVTVLAIGLIFLQPMSLYFKDGLLALTNNFWYYHALLWRENFFVTFFGLAGLVLVYRKDRTAGLFFTALIALHFVFVAFMFSHYMSKYALTIYFSLLLLSGLSLQSFFQLLSKELLRSWRQRRFYTLALVLLPGIMMLLIVANGNLFVRIPQTYYSVNSQMRDIAVVDYDEVYTKIVKQVQDEPSTIVLETWSDRGRWYLGDTYPHLALFRSSNGGAHRNTAFSTYENGIKYVPKSGRQDFLFVGSLDDLEMIMTQHKFGFLWIDDTALPIDVQDYAERSLHLEYSTDSYPPEMLENPYSRWPAKLYSWGISSPESAYREEL